MMRSLFFLLTAVHRLAGALKTGDMATIQTTAATVYDQITVEKARLQALAKAREPQSRDR